MKIKITVKRPEYIPLELHERILDKMHELKISYWNAFAFCKCEFLCRRKNNV